MAQAGATFITLGRKPDRETTGMRRVYIQSKLNVCTLSVIRFHVSGHENNRALSKS